MGMSNALSLLPGPGKLHVGHPEKCHQGTLSLIMDTRSLQTGMHSTSSLSPPCAPCASPRTHRGSLWHSPCSSAGAFTCVCPWLCTVCAPSESCRRGPPLTRPVAPAAAPFSLLHRRTWQERETYPRFPGCPLHLRGVGFPHRSGHTTAARPGQAHASCPAAPRLRGHLGAFPQSPGRLWFAPLPALQTPAFLHTHQ